MATMDLATAEATDREPDTVEATDREPDTVEDTELDPATVEATELDPATVEATELDLATVETRDQPTDLATEAEATEWETVTLLHTAQATAEAMAEATNVLH